MECVGQMECGPRNDIVCWGGFGGILVKQMKINSGDEVGDELSNLTQHSILAGFTLKILG